MASGRNEFTFLWFIENYSYCQMKNGEWLRSPRFTPDGLEGTRWNLLLFPRGKRLSGKGFISLYLKRWESHYGPGCLPLKFELSVLAEDGSVLSSNEYVHSFKIFSERGDDDFLKIDETLFRRNFPQEILTVRCKMCYGEGDVHRVDPIHARTRIGIEKLSFLHEVRDFSLLQENQRNTIEIQSPSTTETEAFATSSLYFTNDSCRDGGMIVEVTLTYSHQRLFLCKRKISLMMASGVVVPCADDDNRFNRYKTNIQKLPLSVTRQEILNKKTDYLLDDKLSLKCECSFYTSKEFDQILRIPYEMPKPVAERTNMQEPTKKDDNKVDNDSGYPRALEKTKTLYMKITDVELKTKTMSFPAHKIVLRSRSPVFKRMLSCNKKNTDCIEVDDLGDDVVQQFLLFLYSDTFENLELEMATRLYYAANKYHVESLKAFCSSFLKENLTPTNAGDLLFLANTHSDGKLKKIVEDFISDHEREVFGSKEWEKFMKSHPELALETMHQKYKRQKKCNNNKSGK